jgi:hypothetical protein
MTFQKGSILLAAPRDWSSFEQDTQRTAFIPPPARAIQQSP